MKFDCLKYDFQIKKLSNENELKLFFKLKLLG